MIKINLATRKQSAGGEGRPSSGSNQLFAILEKLGIKNLDDVKELPLRKIGATAGVALLATFFMNDYQQDQIKKIETTVKKLNVEKTKLTEEVEKTKSYDAVKKSLDQDEFILKTKSETIAKLIADRQTPPKLLVALSSVIPADVWLYDLKVEATGVKLRGASLGYNQISDFMKNMNENPFFTDLRLDRTEQVSDKDGGGTIAQFELQARRRQM